MNGHIWLKWRDVKITILLSSTVPRAHKTCNPQTIHRRQMPCYPHLIMYLAVLSLYSLLLLVILLGVFFMRLCVFFAFVQSCEERNFYSNGTWLGGFLKQLAMNGLSKLKHGAINVELIFTNPHLPSHYILDLQRGGCDMHLQQIMPSGNQFVFNRRLNQHSSIFRSFYCLFDVSA
jgi:hypothetical protein